MPQPTSMPHLDSSRSPESPDIMNDPAFAPPERRRTGSSADGSEKIETCRICRSEGTVEEPLFYPCKCSGSIKFVHQDCLMEWLAHSHKKHCELCKTPFRFTKLYDANMPTHLPMGVFLRRACVHIAIGIVRGTRTMLVGFVWLALIPWLIRWAWRWLFWIADAAWAREAYIDLMQKSSLALQKAQQHAEPMISSREPVASSFHQFFDPAYIFNETREPLAFTLASAVARNIGFVEAASNHTTLSHARFSWPQADPSILSSWTYLSSMTPDSRINRIILDIFEGQIITCVVIAGFILVFLIREWVVQQQPLVNLENLGNVQQQLREAADRAQADNDRLVRMRQRELLDEARRQLIEVQEEPETHFNASRQSSLGADFVGWDALEELIDHATEHLRKDDESERILFLTCAETVTTQIRAAGTAGVNLDEFTDKVFKKIASFADDERKEWEGVLASQTKRPEGSEKFQRESTKETRQEWTGSAEAQDIERIASSSTRRRPQMPDRDFSSRATHIQRLLAETDESPTSSTVNLVPVQNLDSNVALSLEHPVATNGPRAQGLANTTTEREPEFPTEIRDDTAEPEVIPITNAGPDAKINIKRTGKVRSIVPAPTEQILEKTEENFELETDEVKSFQAMEAKDTAGAENQSCDTISVNLAGLDERHFQTQDDSSNCDIAHSPGDLLTGDLGKDGEIRAPSSPGELQEQDFADNGDSQTPHTGEPLPSSNDAGDRSDTDEDAHEMLNRPQNLDYPKQTVLGQLTDWFWGDITTNAIPETDAAVDDEQRLPVEDGLDGLPLAQAQQIPDEERLVDQPLHENEEHDAEVVAAAAQAGLDAEAVEDAEDLEGVLELIGLQGPLLGLFQTSAFCALLVGTTILCAVVFPYIGGKMVLSVIGSPLWFCLKAPLQLSSFMADLLIDSVLFVSAWSVLLFALAWDFLRSTFHAQPLDTAGNILGYMASVSDYATTAASRSGERLQRLVMPQDPVQGLGWSWALLAASAHSHESLRNLEAEIDSVLNYMGFGVSEIVDTISSGAVVQRSIETLRSMAVVPSQLGAFTNSLENYTEPLLEALTGLRRGSLKFDTLSAPMDPGLVYWNSTDRALAMLAGYLALAAAAAVYVALDTPITRSESGRKTEKIVRDTLRQAGGVLKVILIISIEMLVFPLYCGLLLDLAFLPLSQGATISTRWTFATVKPYTFCFVHWFIGTCYMFHFALFVGMCRKILRKGVLWFIRDPDDPTFHPVRDVLERGVVTQLRKIAFSALVYGALVILCLGGVIWAIGKACDGIFPVYWVSTEPVLEFPIDLLLYNFIAPLVMRLFQPSDVVNRIYAWWLRRCARMLRLSHFLFNDRKKDEEGHFVHTSWTSFVFMHEVDINTTAAPMRYPASKASAVPQVYFKRDGKYVLTPCNDQYRPPKPGEAFLHADENDVYITDKDGKKNEYFAKVYVPPFFRTRITLFMVCLWMFSAAIGLCATLVPLVFGRLLLSYMLSTGTQINDIYAYSIGSFIIGSAIYLALNGKSGVATLTKRVQNTNVAVWFGLMKTLAAKAFACAYFYGFLGIALPILFALVLQFYLILPLHTYTTASKFAETKPPLNTLALMHADLNSTQVVGDVSSPRFSAIAQHTMHILQDYALGLLYVRLAARFIITAPASRAAEAFRRITANGYLNPNISLATRYFVLPVSIIAVIVLLLPLVAAQLALAVISTSVTEAGIELQIKLYRYSYPIAASCIGLLFGVLELGKAAARWRAGIRDEVYLVRERLHNFGETKPPTGSKNVTQRQ